MIIQEFVQGVFVPVEKLDESERGEGGFGHTGK
jgi:dUTPase